MELTTKNNLFLEKTKSPSRYDLPLMINWVVKRAKLLVNAETAISSNEPANVTIVVNYRRK